MKSYNWTIIILGMTGDLAKRKLLPALAALMKHGSFKGIIIGTGREDVQVKDILANTMPFIDQTIHHEVHNKLESVTTYDILDFANPHDFERLASTLKEREREHPTDGRLVYCATASDFYCDITAHLVSAGIIESHNPTHRIVYEKPFGRGKKSAHEINECIKRSLAESQVYRIDHYLAKEFVSTILLLRYANTLFKSIWNKEAVAAVKIFFDETIGLEGRGQFYDRYGALRDVMQNHVLQLLALTAMEEPSSLDVEDIRQKKADVLKAVRVTDVVLGQYEGYTDEPGIEPESRTETYAALKAYVDLPAWEGVPFYLQTGKALNAKKTEIQLHLRPVDVCLWSEHGGACEPNVVTIDITPVEGFSLRLNAKKPGTLQDIVTVTSKVAYSTLFGPTSVEAYEILLREILAGNQSVAVRFDEIEYQWDIIDALIAQGHKLHYYAPGSEGPKRGRELMHERIV